MLPTALVVCHESREEALRSWQPYLNVALAWADDQPMPPLPFDA